MAYVLDEGYATVGDLDDFGVTPAPCPPGTAPNPKYPAHSATPCKAIAGYTPPEQVGFGTEAGTQSGSGMLRITPSGQVMPSITVGPKPPKPPIGTTLPGLTEPGPSGPASGGAPVARAWYVTLAGILDNYKWWVVGGSAALLLVTVVVALSGKKTVSATVPVTADWDY